MTPFQQLYLGLGAAKKTYVDDLISTYLYDGTGSAQSITNGLNMSGEGGMTWIKRRDGASDHVINDTVRGHSNTIMANQTTASTTQNNFLTGFSSTGFTVSTDNYVNASGSPYSSWSFRKAPGFFDIVTYTGSGSTQNISHNLGSVPGFILIKNLTDNVHWAVYHREVGNQKILLFNDNQAAASSANYWNNTSPTATQFTVNSSSSTNGNGKSYVAYIFAHDAQSFGEDENASVIKCGDYSGNGNSEGPEIDLGWEPQWLMIKRTDSADNWAVFDTMRGISVGAGYDIQQKVDINNGESTSLNRLELRSYGFKIKSNDGDCNENNGNYIYVAIRRPDGFVGKPYGEDAATDVFAMDAGNSSNDQAFTSGFPVDLAIAKRRDSNSNWETAPRMMQLSYLLINETNAAAAFDKFTFDDMTGWNTHNAYGADWQSFMWKRQGKGFDIVHYLGNSSAGKTIQHGLNAVPEMIWVKRRESASWSWQVYHAGLENAAEKYMELNTDSAVGDQVTRWNDTAPTSTVFSLGTNNAVNGGGDSHMAFLFSSVAGVSKIGNYTGDGGTSNAVDCGFQPRFVIIKRVDSSGDWKVWDTLGGNGMMRMNTNNQSYNDVLRSFTSTGFTLISGDATVNGNNGKYIFYAHA